jgi:hypothetical protein
MFNGLRSFSFLAEIANTKIANALKLFTIYSYAQMKSNKKFLKPNFSIEQLAQQITVRNANAQEQLSRAVTTFAPENKCSKFSVVTTNMIVIGKCQWKTKDDLQSFD